MMMVRAVLFAFQQSLEALLSASDFRTNDGFCRLLLSTVQKPTIVTHSTVGSFIDAGDLNLIIAKHNHIEIYDFSLEAGLRLLKDFPVNGSITTLKLLRPTGQTKDFLLLGTESNNKSSFKFFVLSWDADQNDVITRDSHEILDHMGEGDKICIFNHDCSLIGLRTLDGLSVNSVKFFHLSREGQIEVEYSIRLDTLQDALFWDSKKDILDIKFLHNSQRRILAVLYKVDQTCRKVTTYEITSIEDEDEDDEYGLVEGPWSTHTHNAAKLLIPVPPPCDGVLAVGDKKIVYCSKSMPVEVQFHPGFVFEKRRDKPSGCIGLDYDFGDVVHGVISTDGLRFLFSGQNRNLQLLVLTPNDKKVTQLKLYLLGKTSIASSLSYLGNGIVYLGSRSGDSELIKLNLQPDPGGDHTKLEVLERFPNLGPVSDSCLAVLDHQRLLVTCSGGYDDGSLRILRKEFQMEEQSFCKAAGIDGMWWLKFSKDDPYDGFLVVNVLEKTLIFKISPESVLTSDIADIAGIFCSDQTLLCHNALDSIVTQVTSTSVRLLCLMSRKLQHEWKPPQSHNIIHASATDTEVLVATKGACAHLYYLEIIGTNLQLKEQTELDHEIASLVVGVTEDAPNADAKYAAVGTWLENSIRIYSLPNLLVRTVKRLEAQPRSLLIVTLEGISYLFCGTANGSIVYFLLDTTTGDLTGMKTLSFGMRPVTLELIEHNTSRKVFISSDQPAIIYSLCKNLHVTSVNRKGVNRICSFSTPNVPSGLVIASEDRLTLEALGDMKIHVHSIDLHEQPVSIAHQGQSQTFTVACVKYSGHSETCNIYLFDECTFHILDTYRLEPSSFGVVYGVSLLSCVFSGDNQEYVCVGTAGMTGFDRRIKVLVIRQGRLELVSHTSVFYGGPLFSLTAFSGKLLAGSGCEFVIFKWDTGERTLEKVYQHQAAGGEYASCLQFLGNSIFGGKLPQLMHFTEGRGIESLAHNPAHRLTAVNILKAGVYVGATTKQALLFFRRNEVVTDEERGLEVVGQYDLGDHVTRFCHGSLVSVGDITTVLFSTINGGIGLLASLPEQSYGFMEQLQGSLRRFINQADEGWRLCYHKIQPADASKLLDGDLIKSFSDLEINRKRDIAQEMGMSVEDIDNKVKEVTRFH